MPDNSRPFPVTGDDMPAVVPPEPINPPEPEKTPPKPEPEKSDK
jgi:hypothetical protein